jgi:hypothetical protein
MNQKITNQKQDSANTVSSTQTLANPMFVERERERERDLSVLTF